jgi:cell division protease FtsH
MADKKDNQENTDNTEAKGKKNQKNESKSGNSIFNKDNNGLGGTSKPKFNIYWVYGLIIVAFLSINFFNFGGHVEEINRGKFEAMLQSHEVERIVVVNNVKVDVYIKQDKLNLDKYKKLFNRGLNSVAKTGPHFTFTIGSVDVFEKQLEIIQKDFLPNERITAEYITKKDIFGDLLAWLLPFIILAVIWVFIFRKMNSGGGGGAGNIFNVGKSRAQIFDKDTTVVKIDFKDVAGLEEAKIEIKEIVDFLKNPKKYTDLGGKIPKGALLVGPPGTGKTLLAKAVAGEANVPFFSISGSDFVEMFVGVGASRVRDLFKQAKEKAPCIVFIDEIDAIGRARGRNANFGANDERENTLNQLLTEMDGFATNTGVIILAATNRADILDRALLRAGRFDRQIHVELPDLNERKDIFKVHLRPLKIEQELDVDFLSRQTPGFSGADIANVCNESALIAARNNKKQVERQDFLDAIDRIVGGLEKKNKIISPTEKKTIAYHEAGHATISWMLEHANPLVKVTIIPRGRSLGAAWYLPEERQITTTEQMLDEMCATLGGRAAEEVILGAISTGALNDLERVTKQAYAMISYFGMSKTMGNISFYDSSGQSEYAFVKPFSEKTSEMIDKEVSDLIAMAYDRSKLILTQNLEGLNNLATILLEKEVIFSEDLEQIFGKRKYPIPHEHVQFLEGTQTLSDVDATKIEPTETNGLL